MTGSVVLDAPADERDRLARLALAELFEPGDHRVDSLMSGMSPLQLFIALRESGDSPEMSDAQEDIALRMDSLRPDRTLELGERQGFRYITPADEEWPSQVDALAGLPPIQARTGAPLGLWVRGDLPLTALEKSVAIVGSRSATSYGVEAAGQLAASLADKLLVVSGGAFGVDAAAHRGALAAGRPTVTVLAGGVDMLYPTSHERLFAAIAETGAIVSEMPPGMPVMRMRFLSRNRLIAGLTRGTVLVEAALRSGAINTANWTAALCRPLMCVPGQLTSVTSQGVHEQVRLGKGVLVAGAEDVLELVSRPGEHLVPPRRGPEKARDRLTVEQRQVLDAVPVSQPATSERIAREAKVGLKKVGGTMPVLEAQGLVARSEDGWQLAPGAVDR